MTRLASSSLASFWQARARCQGMDVNLFFPDRLELGEAFDAVVAEAKAVCGACPVRADCLEAALDRGERDGIWGGATERERDAVREERTDQEGRAFALADGAAAVRPLAVGE